jgi:hypothetical protein
MAKGHLVITGIYTANGIMTYWLEGGGGETLVGWMSQICCRSL